MDYLSKNLTGTTTESAATMPEAKPISLPVIFYNLRVHRDQSQVNREIAAILKTGVAIFGMCEAIGYKLPRIPGYTLIRSNATKPQQNIAAYVKDTLTVNAVNWYDMKLSYPRTEDPGMHEPRTVLVLRIGWTQVIITHLPAGRQAQTEAAKREVWNFITQRINANDAQNDKRAAEIPRLAMFDSNGIRDAEKVAKATNSRMISRTEIDTGIYKKSQVHSVDYKSVVSGVVLRSDHRHCLSFKWRVNSEWMKR